MVSYGNQNIIVNGNPNKSLFKATYKKYTNFGMQKHVINCNITIPQLNENTFTIFDFNVPKYGDLISDSFFTVQMPHIWSPVFVEPTDIYDFSGGQYVPGLGNSLSTPNQINQYDGMYNVRDISGTESYFPRQIGSANIPSVQPYEFRWIDDLGGQLIDKVTLSIGGLTIQEFSGDYLTNLVKRDFTKEKGDLFNEMTGNIPEMNNPAFGGDRNGLYPNCLFGAPLSINSQTTTQYRIWSDLNDLIDKNYQNRTNINPSIYKRLLVIPLNFWYMFSSSQALPLISMSKNQLRIRIRCRPIRELFRVRDIRSYIDTYYHHNIAVKKMTDTGSGISIYKHYYPNYYTDPSGIYFSQIDIFKPYQPPPFISTINTTDPLFQMYMFTTQFACQNQQYIKQAALRSTISASVSGDLRGSSLWNLNPRIISTYIYLDKDEQHVFKNRPQSYLIKQIQEFFLEKKFHKEFTQDRFKSNGIVSNWMWYQIRSDVNLRNEWSNYTNWEYKNSKPRTLQPMFYTDLSKNWFINPNSILPFWETITHDTANPNPQFETEPLFLEYTTSEMPVSNISETKYIHSYIDPFYVAGDGAPYTWGSLIGDNGISPGAPAIFETMNKMPKYFPFSYRKVDISINSVIPYKYGVNPYITGPLHKSNRNKIFTKWGLLLDGKIREDNLDSDYYNYVEPFLRASGGLVEGLYCYNFGLNSNPYLIEPNGAMNLINYKHIDYEYTSIGLDVINDISKVAIIPLCTSTDTGEPFLLGYNKTSWNIYNYTFNLKIMEERYNLLTISDGLATLNFKTTS